MIDLDLFSRTHMMGILNVTPDSFSDGGRYLCQDRAVEHGLAMEEEGADIIDVGGESSRPGSLPCGLEEEKRRVIPIIKQLAKKVRIPISIDTYKSEVAEAALAEGAAIVNDISALRFDPKMAEVVAKQKACVVLMHIKGTPGNMQQNPTYGDLMTEIISYLGEGLKIADGAGISQAIIDPGIGFGKTADHNLEIIRRLSALKILERPILIGPSRKSFIGHILDLPIDQRLEGTAAACCAAILNGANIIRVHDVRQMKRVARMTDAIKGRLKAEG